jgi:hypothetical protein
MAIKKSPLIALSLILCHMYNYGSQCTGEVAKKRPELFVRAEEDEQNYARALAECLKNDDCETNPVFKRAQDDIAQCVVIVENYLEELKKGKSGACNVCEKTEAQDIHDRLTQLVKSNQ